MKLLPVIVAALVLGGCTTPNPDNFMGPMDYVFGEDIREVTFPDGRAGYVVYCERGIDYCYERSRHVCKGNYKVVSRTESDEDTRRSIEISCPA